MKKDNLKKGDKIKSNWNGAIGTITGLGDSRIKITFEDGTLEQRARSQFDSYYVKL